MTLLSDNEINREKWNLFLSENKFSTPFQSVDFFDFINSVPGQYAKIFACEVDNILQALCVVTFQKEKGIKGYFSRRAIIYGGPLIKNGKEGKAALRELLKVINRYLVGKTIFGEIRNLSDYTGYKDCFLENEWQYEPHLNVQIIIKNKTINDILGSMNYNRRKQIGSSINSGATTKLAENLDEVHSLYIILKKLFHERVKSPLPSFDFFHSLYLSAVGKVFLVLHNSQIIGGAFCIYHSGISINTLYYCSTRDYHKKIFPTHLAIMAAIEFGINHNMQMVDLMGAGKPDKEYGVRTYKTEFGGELVEHGRFVKIFNPFLYRLGTFGLDMLNKIKK